jgi:hypothetical protein
MSVWEAIATGFDGVFVPLGPLGLGTGLSTAELASREERIWAVLRELGPYAWGNCGDAAAAEEFARRPFTALPAGVQSVVLLMRALVGRPPLVLLDEV